MSFAANKKVEHETAAEKALADKNYTKAFFHTTKAAEFTLTLAEETEGKIAKKYCGINSKEVEELLNSKIHEERLISLLLLIEKYKKANFEEKREIFNFYLKNTGNINNWDLVDLSAPGIVGDFLLDKDRQILYELARSDNLWQKRIAIISCFAFIHNFTSLLA